MTSKTNKLYTLSLFILFCNIVIATDYREVGLPIITNFTQENYNAHNQNWDIIQASNGLIYVANGNGLLEYDGETWLRHNTPNRSRIREIDTNGKQIFAGTVNDMGYFSAYKTGALTYHSFNDLIEAKYFPFGEIYSTKVYQNKVIFKAAQYFFIWDGHRITTLKDTTKSRVKIISFKQKLYTKLIGDEHVYLLGFDSENLLKKTPWILPADVQIKAILADSNGAPIFFTAKQGVFQLINGKMEHVLDNFEGNTFIYDAIRVKDGEIYVATINQGLYILSTDLQLQKNYRDIHGLGMNAITAVMSDQQNNIWLTGNSAISVMRPPNEISQYKTSKKSEAFNLKLIQNHLSFLGTGIFQLTENENPLFPAFFQENNLYKNKTIVVWNALDYGTDTLLAKNNALDWVNFEENTVKQSIIEGRFYVYDVVASDNLQQLFIATSNGLYHAQNIKGHWQAQRVHDIDSEVNNLALEDNTVLWIGSSSAQLYRLEIQDINNDSQNLQLFDKNDGIGNNKVVPFNLSLGTVFATNDGIMLYTDDKTKPLKFIENMPKIFSTKDEDAHLLYEDNTKRLWYRIGSHSGFAIKSNNQWQVNEDVFDYFPDLSIKGFVSTTDDIIWFSQTNNIIYRMDVGKAQNLPMLAPLYIRNITNLNSNKIIQAGTVSQLNPIEHQDNSIRIHFALADFAIPNKAVYRTRLVGAQQPKWSEWSRETYKDFTELRGSNYALEIQAKDSFGRVTDSTVLKFTVLPPFYLSTLAYSIYLLLTFVVLFFTAWFVQKWRTKKLLARNNELSKLVDEKTQEIQGHVQELEKQHELKTRFFTNISHELRTPLSLIILPLQKLIRHKREQLDIESRELISLSVKNANNMKALVNQVLDVSRFEEKSMPIAPIKNELVGFVENVANQFQQWAQENQQQLIVDQYTTRIELYFDRQMMEKITSNLLSNAIKFSGQNSTIHISFFDHDTHAGLCIKDNGIGIATHQCQEVFERYFRSKKKSEIHEQNQDSSGIGLAFVKEMVELHHGIITLKSDTDKGCEFILTFKKGHQHFSTVHFEQTEIQQIDKRQPKFKHPEDTSTILVVEDNTDLRGFICQSLSFNYKVIQAINGFDALQTLQHEIPDLIISDIMMPQMDGIEFLQKLREQSQFKTTPFFLLSSKSTQKDTQLGLQYGANDYISKPFDMDELMLRIKNIINSRKLIQQEVKQQLQHIKKQPRSKHNDFEQKLREIIIDNISDSNFSVKTLSDCAHSDRTTLFRHCKKHLKLTPTQLIKRVRLETAKDLLENSNISVSQAAYATGFESLSYFTKLFKQQFETLPSEIRNQ